MTLVVCKGMYKQLNLRIKDMLGQGVLSFIKRFPFLEVKMYWYNRNWDEYICPYREVFFTLSIESSTVAT